MSWLHVVIDLPEPMCGGSAAFWGDVLGWPAGPAWAGHPEFRSFEPPSGETYVHLQQIDGPPRVHLDVEAGTPPDAVARAVSLGASVVAEHPDWQTMRSPGGLPFCVLQARERVAPQPVSFGGHRSRLVQLCIDASGPAHDAEVAFWRSFLDGRWVPSSSDEFAGKWHDDAGSPVQLLFQRLDEPAGAVRAHLDLGTDDVAAEVRRLQGLGADDVGPGRGWHVLRDPAGLLFCATRNSPDQVMRRELA